MYIKYDEETMHYMQVSGVDTQFSPSGEYAYVYGRSTTIIEFATTNEFRTAWKLCEQFSKHTYNNNLLLILNRVRVVLIFIYSEFVNWACIIHHEIKSQIDETFLVWLFDYEENIDQIINFEYTSHIYNI